MIDYFKGIYGINLLFRIHGSALYKGSLVGILSLGVYLAIVLRWNENGRIYANEEESLDHPYGVGVLVGSVTFLIIFRANSGYQRYWEACVSIIFCLLGSAYLVLKICNNLSFQFSPLFLFSTDGATCFIVQIYIITLNREQYIIV